ncbi:P-loop containing nucleoside triphosphate hydrolase protein [Aspergillus steynii IBT 23096]|uniref:P-loop containing nucleoside triphosphate hydrolase protein n=1 Tax=Aspergillus steynii IBT 23096 TaxID=1392250 RepID=A0A2I2FZ70_9EURO|nr:P-loop containing nucleoside triphosphate hydrolase protein [Aspergillus steynii IBT 23096]PLB45930.1 P-loop containing nucleoside triphosphate hydrolase protein [Aspergillus steynii IBT 23096]
MVCPLGSDRNWGPQVAPDCRSFDFTLAFEDAAFGLPPSIFFLLIAPTVWWCSRAAPRQLLSRRLGAVKMVVFLALLAVHVLYTVFRARDARLHTAWALPVAIVNMIAVAVAIGMSAWEDQHRIDPSVVLLLYLSAQLLLSLPQTRSLWLVKGASAVSVLGTLKTILTLVSLATESWWKSRWLRKEPTTVEQRCDFWTRALFAWTWTVFRRGFSVVLSVRDLPPIDEQLRSPDAVHRLRQAGGAVFWAYRASFLSAVVPRLCVSVFTFCQPFLITAAVRLLNEVDGGEAVTDESRGLIAAFVLVYVGLALSNAVYWRQALRFHARVRAGLIQLLYEQSVRKSPAALADRAPLTMMSTDVDRIVTGLRFVHELWAAPLEVAIAVWLLQRQLSVACVVPVVVALGCLLAMSRVSVLVGPRQKQWVERIQQRLETTTVILENMKPVKMLGLPQLATGVIHRLRVVELETSRLLRRVLCWQLFLADMPPELAPMATFAVYSILAAVHPDRSLLADRAFTALSLISILTTPLIIFMQAVPSFMQCLGCFERIREFCDVGPLREDSQPLEPASPRTSESKELKEPKEPSSMAFGCRGASFAWDSSGPVVLHELDLVLKLRSVTMVVGPVGAGKSALLASVVGTTRQIAGHILGERPSAAYCPAAPWMMNQSIRQNIIGFGPFDPTWYQQVLWLCALDLDLAVLLHGDDTVTGSNGVSLSGGQRARIALARAIFSRQPVLILDDVFSGLDAHTLSLIARRLLGPEGYCHRAQVTVVLATHNQSLLSYADEIVFLDRGRIAYQGAFSNLPPTLAKELSHAGSRLADLVKDGAPTESVTSLSRTISSQGGSDPPEAEATKAEPDWARRRGDWSVYRYYAQAAGHRWVLLFAVLLVINAAASNYSVLWLEKWSDANSRQPNQSLGMYLGIYITLNAISIATTFPLAWCVPPSAPFSFFREADTGEITNRFSQDMDQIDLQLPMIAVNTCISLAQCLGKLIILCIKSKYLGIAVPALLVVVYLIQVVYLRTSRQIRLLDIEARAPLFTHFLETIQGIAVLQSLGWESTMARHGAMLVDQLQKPAYVLACIQQWLALVLDLVTAGVAVLVVVLGTQLPSQVSPGTIGVSLNMILGFSQSLKLVMRYWTQLETCIGSVARVRTFVHESPSDLRMLRGPALLPEWPSKGAIDIHNLRVGYLGIGSRLALQDIRLSIRPGEKVAICGGSGSGKTTLLLSLLQLVDVHGGCIQIDGRDLAEIPIADVASRVSVVPQEPFLMPGPLRFTLDPTGQTTDEEMEAALRAAELWDRLCPDGDLDACVAVSSLSMGERQILCLTRALLQRRSILLLDEALSNMDYQTEDLMQRLIDRHFASQTVVAVVHRLRTIRQFDRVVVLRQGRLVEDGSPEELLNRDSALSALYHASEPGQS